MRARGVLKGGFEGIDARELLDLELKTEPLCGLLRGRQRRGRTRSRTVEDGNVSEIGNHLAQEVEAFRAEVVVQE